MSFVKQSLFIILSIGLAMFSKSFSLNSTVLFLGILVVLYLIFSLRKKIVPPQRDPAIGGKNFNLFILIFLVLILISSTGAISSPLFFLLYLLSFGIAFSFDPKTVFVFTVGVIILFFPEVFKTDLTRNLIMLFSVFLLSPFAFFLGSNYQEKQKQKTRIENMKKKTQEIENDIEDVLYDTRQRLDFESANKLSRALAGEKRLEISDKRKDL